MAKISAMTTTPTKAVTVLGSGTMHSIVGGLATGDQDRVSTIVDNPILAAAGE